MNRDKIILKEKYQVISELGKGQFGQVYKVKDITNDNFYAIKRLKKDEICRSEYLLSAYNKELLVMKECECENSVKYYEQFVSSSNLNIVMELCDGDLEHWINKHKGFINENQLREIICGLNNVFKIMDQKNIVHRDLKLKNIMIVYKKDKNQVLDIIPKLSDFGFSKIMDESDITRTKLGTPATMAPEILMGREYTNRCDIWSLGVIMYQLLYKTLPFKARNESDLLKFILSNKFKLPEGCKISEPLNDLLSKMLVVDPKKRISWQELFNHPFLDDNSDSELDRFDKTYGCARKLSEDNQGIYNITKAKNRLTGEMVFIKEIDRKLIDNNPENKKIFDKEISLMKELRFTEGANDSFIKLIDIFKTKKQYLIVTEYFEGQLLESYITKRKPISDNMVIEMIYQIINGLDILHKKKIVLESLTTKSLCFKYFKDQTHFQLKFFDLGLSKIFNEQNFERSFNLEQPFCEKTNVLSFGLILYKICFGANLFTFNNNENFKEVLKRSKFYLLIHIFIYLCLLPFISAAKIIKIKRSISKSLKELIEKTCLLNSEKRYSLLELLSDKYINQVKECVSLKLQHNSLNLNQISNNYKENQINDFQIENLIESTISKAEAVIKYYSKLFCLELKGMIMKSCVNLKKEENLSESLKYFSPYYNEISTFLILLHLEIEILLELMKGNFNENDGELHLVKITPNNKYDYSYANFSEDKIYINLENPKFEEYCKTISILKEQIFFLNGKVMKLMNLDIQEIETFEYLKESLKNFYSASTEKYFFALFDKGVKNYSQKDIETAFEELMISKYYYENLVFIRLISHNKLQTAKFFDIAEYIECEDIINLQSDMKIPSITHVNDCLLYTFLGGIYKAFKNENIIEEALNTQSTIGFSTDAVESLINFFPEILKFIIECSK